MTISHKAPRRTVDTTWDLRSYDVWGNATDGYEVNQSFSAGNVTIRCKLVENNAHTPHAFISAFPSDYQLQRICHTRAAIDVEGDDLTIYISRASDGYPLGELHCTSHASLSPVRACEVSE